MGLKLPNLDKTMPLVTGKIMINGKLVEFEAIATPQMQRFWQRSTIKIDTPGGGVSYAGGTAADPYDPAQMQALMNAVAAIYSA
jgi:hypothetical protein